MDRSQRPVRVEADRNYDPQLSEILPNLGTAGEGLAGNLRRSGVAKPQTYPDNELGLSNGAQLMITRDAPFLDLVKGDAIEVAWDGQYVRCQSLSWSAHGLNDEVKRGLWTVLKTGVNQKA